MMIGKKVSGSGSEKVRKNEDSISHGTLSSGSVDSSIFSREIQVIVRLLLKQITKMKNPWMRKDS
jgi:hypothetical protein